MGSCILQIDPDRWVDMEQLLAEAMPVSGLRPFCLTKTDPRLSYLPHQLPSYHRTTIHNYNPQFGNLTPKSRPTVRRNVVFTNLLAYALSPSGRTSKCVEELDSCDVPLSRAMNVGTFGGSDAAYPDCQIRHIRNIKISSIAAIEQSPAGLMKLLPRVWYHLWQRRINIQ